MDEYADKKILCNITNLVLKPAAVLANLMSTSWDVVVIGAGAAGLLAGVRAAERGRRVLVLEKNTKPGVKILMSGGTRCNLTHAVDASGIVAAFGRQGPFLHSALAALSPDDVVALFDSGRRRHENRTRGQGLSGQRPGVRCDSSPCDAGWSEAARRWFCGNLWSMCCARSDDDVFSIITPQRRLTAAKLVVTTGGQSYPGCGTTGDGYAWASAARALRHPAPSRAGAAEDPQ